MNTTRSINMQKRRERILAEARAVLSSKGFEALNLRDLAELSKVTVPTIYNLIGNKEEVLNALMLGTFDDFEVELVKQLPCPEAELPELMADTLLGMIKGDQAFYRAAALANERAETTHKVAGGYGITRITIKRIFSDLCRTLLEEGLLKGDIAQITLAEQMTNNHHVIMRDWAHRIISLDEFRAQSLTGFYVTLAADAVATFQGELVSRLKAL